jgi:hypothetical protein
MILRRIAGLTISVLLLQLNFTSSDLACAKHDAQSTEVPHHAATDQQAMAEAIEHHHQPTDASKPCEIPAQSDCCQALVSCSMTLGVAPSGSPAGLAVAHFPIAPSAAEAPAYLIRAPEPPPPKA